MSVSICKITQTLRKSYNGNNLEFNGIITIKRGDLLDNVITRRKIMHVFFFLDFQGSIFLDQIPGDMGI